MIVTTSNFSQLLLQRDFSSHLWLPLYLLDILVIMEIMITMVFLSKASRVLLLVWYQVWLEIHYGELSLLFFYSVLGGFFKVMTYYWTCDEIMQDFASQFISIYKIWISPKMEVNFNDLWGNQHNDLLIDLCMWIPKHLQTPCP